MKMLFVSDEMLQMVANGEELHLPEEISINEIAEFSASKLLEARQHIRELEEMQRWIPVTEKLPKFGQRVQVRMKNNCIVIATLFRNGIWQNDSGCDVTKTVTHWRPLPEPPEEK